MGKIIQSFWTILTVCSNWSRHTFMLCLLHMHFLMPYYNTALDNAVYSTNANAITVQIISNWGHLLIMLLPFLLQHYVRRLWHYWHRTGSMWQKKGRRGIGRVEQQESSFLPYLLPPSLPQSRQEKRRRTGGAGSLQADWIEQLITNVCVVQATRATLLCLLVQLHHVHTLLST